MSPIVLDVHIKELYGDDDDKNKQQQ